MRKKRKLLRFLFNLAIVCTIIGFYAFKIEPNLLITREIEIEINESPQNELKIVLFSDTHFKEDTSEAYVQNIVDTINEQQGDVVMFLGDLIDDQAKSPVDIDYITQKFSEIDGLKLAIMGNHDYGGNAERTYKEIMSDSDFEILINDIVSVGDITIVGVDDMIFGEPNYDILNQFTNADNVVLMLHEGDMIEDLDKTFDIAFSGHSHGGQIAIPYIKDWIMPAGTRNYVSGLYEEDKIYVTSGIGTTFIDARLFCKPEIVVVTLKY
ncbi:MAG: metallophosphoesterase [Clostridia bacterium]